MIKLIATDMDGTLLTTQKELPPNIFDKIREYHEQGILFVPSSGRQVYNLMKIFEPVQHLCGFIAENGGVVRVNDEIIYTHGVDKTACRKAVELIRQIPKAQLVLCGAKSAYIDEDEENFVRNVAMYYERYQIVDDIMDVIDQDEIIKLAIYCPDIAIHVLPYLDKSLYTMLKVSQSADCWTDLMDPQLNKGHSLKKLLEYLHLSADECVVFGDYINDLEMMQVTENSYAMANSHPEILKVAKHQAKSNDENGVLDKIEELLANQ